MLWGEATGTFRGRLADLPGAVRSTPIYEATGVRKCPRYCERRRAGHGSGCIGCSPAGMPATLMEARAHNRKGGNSFFRCPQAERSGAEIIKEKLLTGQREGEGRPYSKSTD